MIKNCLKFEFTRVYLFYFMCLLSSCKIGITASESGDHGLRLGIGIGIGRHSGYSNCCIGRHSEVCVSVSESASGWF